MGSQSALKLMVLFSLVAIQKIDCTCTFPSALSGVWRSSRWGDIDFTSSSVVSVSNLAAIGNIDFQCEVNSGSLYVLRSTTSVTVLANTVDVVTCLDLSEVSSVNFYYYHATTELTISSGNIEPVKLVSVSSSLSTSSVCDVSSPYTTGTNHMLIKSGSETSAATNCPTPLAATFNNYTIDKGSGAQCGGVGYMIIACNADITVDYSVCSEVLFYSSAGSLECVYYSSSGSTYYVNVYNFDTTVDDTATFRFSCIAVESSSDGNVYATQYPRACASSQTSTSVPSSPYQGGTLVLNANASTDSGGGSSILLIIIIVIVLLLLILLALLLYVAYRKRKLPCFKNGRKSLVIPMKDKQAKDNTLPQKGDDVESDRKKEEVVDNNMKKVEEDEAGVLNAPGERPLSAVPPTSETSRATSDQMKALHIPMMQGTQTSLQPDNTTVASREEVAPRRLPPLEASHADLPAVPTREEIYNPPGTSP